MNQNTISDDINTTSEHVAAELIGLHSELEILHIPSSLNVQKFAEMIPQYYGGSFSQESLNLARRLVEERFSTRSNGVTTEEVRKVIMEALESRDVFMHAQEG